VNYKQHFSGLNPVAIKVGQIEIKAPEHETWGTITCGQCGEQFLIGPHRSTPTPVRRVGTLTSSRKYC
jgi:hypothetical protein